MVKQTLRLQQNGKYRVAIIMMQRYWRGMNYGLLLLLIFGPQLLFGQDLESGIEALEEAGEGIANYFEPMETIIYTLAGIMALFGIFKVYSKWQGGDANVMSAAVGWLASVLFLIIAITIIKSFFNI